MINEILDNSDLAEYITSFKKGDIIFLEGDESLDLYILVSGNLDVLKGNKKIAEISHSGDLFGEMSVVLTTGSRISPERLEDTGFRFRYPDIISALRAC